MITVIAIIGLIGLFWLVAGVYRIGDALMNIYADLHDIRCSISTVGEPAHTLLQRQVRNMK